MHDMEIFVDIWGQLEISKLLSTYKGYKPEVLDIIPELGLKIELPTFPLNTDGFDIWGRNMTFRRIKITNFDDAIVPKPTYSSPSNLFNCTEDIYSEDIETWYTVGMTIGSVPPHVGVNCIRNVVFKNVYMHKPLKGIYVKSNPGTSGTGLIKNITYENFQMDYPVWFGIYIGPQQQKQPGGAGPGCMIYPLEPCQTNPLITMEEITLRNITGHGSLLFAGIIRCNSTNPCKNFVFDDVQMKSPLWDLLGIGYISEFIEGEESRDYPDPDFKPEGYYTKPANIERQVKKHQSRFNPFEIAWNVITAPQSKWDDLANWLKDPVIINTLLSLLFPNTFYRL